MSTSTTKPRVGRRMAEIAAIVSARPGISKRGALLAAGLPLSGPGRDAPVHRAEQAGLVVIERARVNRHRLFANERDRQRFHLRAELLRPGIPAERVAAIRAEMSTLDAERAASWKDSDEDA
jgi:hypothetical protein